MPRLYSFSSSFSTTSDSQGTYETIVPARELHSLTIEVETDNVGVILVNAHIAILGKKIQLGQPTGIYNGDGYNARLFEWTGQQPLSRFLENILTINWSNYCGDDAILKYTGTVKK